MTDFSLRQKGIILGARIDIIGDSDNLEPDFLENATGYITLRNPRGVVKRLRADSMFIENRTNIVLGYNDTEEGRTPLPDDPIFDVAGQWDKGAEVVWPDGRTISVPLDSTSIIDVS